MKNQIKLWFKFNKYTFIELSWSLISLACDAVLIYKWHSNLFTPFHIIWFILSMPITFFGFYRTYESLRSYKVRLDDYLQVTDMFKRYGVKKSVLYSLQETPCSATVAEQLVKDFDIKDVKLYTDDL